MDNQSKLNFKLYLANEVKIEKFDCMESADPQDNFDKFHDIIISAHSSCFKEKRVRCDRRKVAKLPWITSGLIRSIRNRNNLYKKFKNTDESSGKYQVLKSQLKNYGKVLRNSIKVAKRNYYAKVLEHQKNEPRKMWATISKLTSGQKTSHDLLQYFIIDEKSIQDKLVITDEFNNYFINIASKMIESLGPPNSSFKRYLNEHIDYTFSFKPVTEDQILKAIDFLNGKRTLDSYGLSTEIIKLCKYELAPSLTIIINQCIKQSIFPE